MPALRSATKRKNTTKQRTQTPGNQATVTATTAEPSSPQQTPAPMPTAMNVDNIDPQLLQEEATNVNTAAAAAPPAAAAAAPPADAEAQPQVTALDLEANPGMDLAGLVAHMQALQTQFQALIAPPTEPGADPRFNATGRRLIAPTLSDAPGSVPKPRGSAGGGRRGYHLKAAMGLTGPDSDKLYNMILATVRELVHASRINLAHPYRAVSAEDLSRIFTSARKIHPYLARFERDWATAAIVKQYMSSARRYGKDKGYFPSAASGSGSQA